MEKFSVFDITFSEGTKLELPELTVLIGPNNSGKSRTLKEILAQLVTPQAAPGPVLKNIDFYVPTSFEGALKLIDKPIVKVNVQGNLCFRTIAPTLDREHLGHIGLSLDVAATNYNKMPQDRKRQHFGQMFGPALALHLTTEQRISLANENQAASLDYEESNLLQTLYNLPSKSESEIQEQVLQAFSKHIKLDYSVPQKLCFRVADNIDTVSSDPRDARPILAKYQKIDEQGDGIRSYVGLMTALLTTDRKLVLVDEPEAFLHPPQAFRMGSFIAESKNDARQMLVATHSPDILRGLLTKKGGAKIIRIEQRSGKNLLKELPVSELKKIVTDPLLGSSRVLEGLFASATVVVEADADARFYQTLIRKLAPRLDIQCIVADNKQTVPKIIALYKKLGVRSIGIIDIDLLSVSNELKNSCNDVGIDESYLAEIMEAQSRIENEIKESEPTKLAKDVLDRFIHVESHANSLKKRIENKDTGDGLRSDLTKFCKEARRAADSGKEWKIIKETGTDSLSSKAKLDFELIDKKLREVGLFLNPCGELEASLVEYGFKHSHYKKDWFVSAMKMLDGIELKEDKKIVRFIKEIVDVLK